MQKKPLILLSGPSGVGKTTLIERLLEKIGHLQKIVSYTTRPQRGNEEQGVSYFFVSEKEFFEREKNGEFIESACIYHYNYAVSKKQVELSWFHQKVPIKDVDVQGLRFIKKLYPHCFSVGIFPTHKGQVKERIEKRNVDFGKNLKTRLKSQDKEVEVLKKEVDIQVINDDIEETLKTLKKEIENYLENL